MKKSKQWYDFQEQIAEHFRTLGVSAKTNVSIEGVRTSHDVDILVSTKFLGADITWIVEAKSWRSNVPKEKVLALRSIVDDTGADRGFLISEKGFQSGAWKAAHKTNVELVKFTDLKAADYPPLSNTCYKILHGGFIVSRSLYNFSTSYLTKSKHISLRH